MPDSCCHILQRSCRIILLRAPAMDLTLQHFNQYNTESVMDWPGLHSNRFPRPRLMHPKKDLIGTSFNISPEPFHTTRKHYRPDNSPEYQFKPRLRQFKDQEHWHLRASSKKMVDIRFSEPHSRYEKGHFKETGRERSEQFAGIRTFYTSRLRDNQKEYSVEDRMQRKARSNQLELRQQAFKDESLRLSHLPHLKA